MTQREDEDRVFLHGLRWLEDVAKTGVLAHDHIAAENFMMSMVGATCDITERRDAMLVARKETP